MKNSSPPRIIPLAFSNALLDWYDRSRRDLPWRPAPDAAPHVRPDAYLVFVSEAMLQQTQVATVIGYFNRFIAALPTVGALADADEQTVLKLWQGLGYYSRGRNLRKAARAIVERFDGRVPTTVAELLTLPGVGRYTAGAIASIAHGTRAPIVDGNVVRVICRLDAITADPRDRAVQSVLWARAEELLPGDRVGEFNSGLMELGATVCTPKKPACLICPVRQFCRACAAGIAEQIPPPKKTKPLKSAARLVVCLRDDAGRYLVAQRPPTGRWAGMWQFATISKPDGAVAPDVIAPPLGLQAADIDSIAPLAVVTHTLTHRHYTFTAVTARSTAARPPGVWLTLDELAQRPLSKPQARLLTLLTATPAID